MASVSPAAAQGGNDARVKKCSKNVGKTQRNMWETRADVDDLDRAMWQN